MAQVLLVCWEWDLRNADEQPLGCNMLNTHEVRARHSRESMTKIALPSRW